MNKPADKDKPRDWDKELAEVDRLLAKLPHADPTLGRGQPPSHKPGLQGPTHTPPGHGPGGAASPPSATAVWIRVALATLVGLAMTQWPYSHACGLKLLFYMIGAGAVVAGSIWSLFGTWRRRMGLTHGLSIGLLVWGMSLLTSQVLPRVGASSTALWFCPEPPAAP